MTELSESLMQRVFLTEADTRGRELERRSQESGSDSDIRAYLTHMRRYGQHDNHFTELAHRITHSHKEWMDADRHHSEALRAGNLKKSKSIEERVKRLASNHRKLVDGFHQQVVHFNGISGENHHARDLFHQGELSAEDHIYGLAALHGLQKIQINRRRGGKVRVSAEETVPQGDHAEPYPKIDEFKRSVRQHHSLTPTTKSDFKTQRATATLSAPKAVAEALIVRSILSENEDPHAHLKADESLKPPSGPSNRYYSWPKLVKAHRANYFEGDAKRASSREAPAKLLDIPQGSWRIDDGFKGIHGREIDELQAHRPRDITPHVGEMTWKGGLRERARHPDVERYANWLEKAHNEHEASGGKSDIAKIPPISVTKHATTGEFHIGDGHRRLAAVDLVNQRRKAEGKGPLRIPGWTSWTASHPEGINDSEGREMKVGLTHEIASKGGEIDRSRTKPVIEERAERCGSVAVSLLKPGTKKYERWLTKKNRHRAATMRKKQQEDQMSFKATNLRTGKTVTSEDMAKREASRQEFLAEAARKHELRENAQAILFWSEEHRPQDYENCVSSVPTERIDLVVEALQSGENVQQARGWAQCRICDENLGSADLAGHGYMWPSQAEHYVVEHGVWTPELDKFANSLVEDAKQTIKTDVDKEVGKHCGVFIPLPYSLAKDFPKKDEEDSSVPHYTLLYMGDLSPKAYKVFCNVVRKFAQNIKPFECDISSYNEFLNKEGQKIPHMRPSAACATKLALLHVALRRYIEQFGKDIGATIKHNYGGGAADPSMVPYEIQFKPHATLSYLSPMLPYTGPKPTGSWRVNEIECWGYERISAPLGKTRATQPTGLTRDPLAIKYPMAVPDAVAEDKIPGGLADKASPEDFDPKALARGIKVELEHTSSRAIAREIAMDHLTEDPRYYDKLAKMEKRHEDVVTGAMGGSNPGVGGSSGDIGLAGSLPYLQAQKQNDKKLQREKLAGLKK